MRKRYAERMAAEDTWDKPPLAVTDPAMLRAFAHPMRQQILQELFVRNHARAADLAQWLGAPANVLSFHLRTLAKAGLVQELPEKARDKRDRVWGLAYQGGFTFEDPSDPTLLAYVSDRLDWLRHLIAQDLENDQAVSAVQFGGALLTKAQAKELSDEISDVLAKWRKRGADDAESDPDDSERVYHEIAFAIGPISPGETPVRPA